jgi:hypothetical protein
VNGWKFEFAPSSDLPPLAWVAHVEQQRVRVACGTSVRRSEDAFFDGTWAGDAGLASVLESTTPFGAGMVVRDGRLFVVPAGHTCEGIYLCRPRVAAGTLFVSNSIAALLEATNQGLVAGVDYVSRFINLAEGLSFTPIEIPTSASPIEFHFFENLAIDDDGRFSVVRKPREKPFASYEDYLARLESATASLFANAPDYEPVIALSNGYDSTAMAVVAARAGLRRALTFATVRPARSNEADTSDSGEATAQRLGIEAQVLDRVSYMTRDDLPEAEFLATGGPGEDVANTAMESELKQRILVSGDVGAALYRFGRPKRSDLWRLDLSGSSMTEFRLRADFIFAPLPVFGMTEIPSLQDITLSTQMEPWSIGGYYDRPIARRIAEEAGGLPRGSFATVKHAATALIHQDPQTHMAPASVASVREFAAREGTTLKLVARRPLRRRERFVIKASHRLRADRFGRGLAARQWAMIHHEPGQGSVLFRWGVETIRPRYAAVRELLPRGAASEAGRRGR